MAVLDGMALNLESEDQRKSADENGLELLQRWEERYRTDDTEMTNTPRTKPPSFPLATPHSR